MITGHVTNNKSQGNFVKRMNETDREAYLKDWIARCNPQALVPFITITKHDRYWRTIKYEIRTGNGIVKGTTHQSRRESDQFLSLTPAKREDSIKQFIAACNPKALMPFIEITDHDENYRVIDYKIDTEKRET